MENQVDSQADFQRILEMLVASFPVEFTVAKGGKQVRLNINDNGRWLVLFRDGHWEYE